MPASGQAYVGHEGMRHYFEDVGPGVAACSRSFPHEYRDLGDRVLVFGRVYARGEGGYISDSPTPGCGGSKDGLIVSGRVFTSRAEALAGGWTRGIPAKCRHMIAS